MADPVPYLARGGEKLTTESTTLISSSDYLNEPRLRDWLATAFLRKSGKDSPTTHDAYKLYGILVDVFDIDRIEALFTAERKRWPELDAWFAEGFSSSFSKADLLAYPEGSFGHRFGRYIHDNGFEIDIVPRFVPKNQFQYFSLRSGQTHDLEHILTGGGFDILGELVPYFTRLSNLPRFLDPELVGLINAGQVLGALRLISRTGLHYHAAFPSALAAMRCGMTVGEASGPYWMRKFEDAFHLPLDEARAALGIVGAVDLDTRAASMLWPEYA
ncbi:Coq4 family protein [Novosphingobium sp.]|uniref:Coq4 family protein n=1 Tax=Novosphingobium sp. TaxID=1874826 RepID=UPI003D14A73C